MLYAVIALVAVAAASLGYFALQRAAAAASESASRQQRHVAHELEEMFIFISVAGLQKLKWGLAAGLAGVGLLLGWELTAPGPLVLSAAFFVFGYWSPETVIFFLRQRRRAMFGEQLVDGLVLMANGLRAGFTLQQAIEMLIEEMPAPISQEFELVRREWKVGVDLNQALLNCAERTKDPDLGLVVNAIQITRQLGGNLGEVFDRIVAMVRERKVLIGKAEALTAEGRMQAVVVGLLPFGFMIAMVKTNPDFMRPMWTTVPGIAALGLVVILDVVGYLWVRKLATIQY
jgi:tight adherence protein B